MHTRERYSTPTVQYASSAIAVMTVACVGRNESGPGIEHLGMKESDEMTRRSYSPTKIEIGGMDTRVLI